MQRLSRVQSQAKTREALVEVARKLFLRDGYHATSLEKVAEAAGYSKGAVYSNFRNKDELCMAAIDAIHTHELQSIGEALSEKDDLEGRFAAFAAWADRMIGDEGWTSLLVEFATQAQRNPRIRDQLVDRARLITDGIAALLSSYGQELGLKPRLSPEMMADALLSMGIGLGLRRALDPAHRVDVLMEVLRVLMVKEAS